MDAAGGGWAFPRVAPDGKPNGQRVTISGREGDDAMKYQEKEVLAKIKEALRR